MLPAPSLATLAAANLLAAAQGQARDTIYQVFEHTPACIALLRGPDHRFAYCNQAYRQLLADAELLDRPLAEVLPEAAAQGFVALLDQVYQTGETYFGHEMPYVISQPGGTPATAYFNFTYQAYREQGQTVGISVFAYEVTEQVRARQQRAAQQQHLHELFVAAPLSICLFGGPEFVYELASEQHQALFPDRALLGRALLHAVPELTGQPVWDVLQRVYQTGETEVNLQVYVPLARGGDALEDTYFDYIFQARRDEQDAITGVLVVAFDVTEQVLSRQQVQALNQKLQRVNTDLANFVYMASHDLRMPIANIEGLVAALSTELGATQRATPLVPKLLTMMQEAVARFQRTIGHLTDISRMQAALTQPTEVIDLASLIEEVRLDMAPLLTRMTADIVVDVAASPRVQFSPKNLRSIVFNLLSNGVKYQHPARAAWVRLRAYRAATGTATVLEVQDNGLGLRPDQQGKLFGLFQRLHSHVEGSGVGLYMVKQMVENVGGTITVDSELGVGTTFTVLLPD